MSIYVAILDRRLAATIPHDVMEAAVSAGLPSSSVPDVLKAITNGTAAAMSSVSGINPTIEGAVTNGLKTAYASSFSTVYLASIGFGGIAIIASLFTKDIDKHLTNYVSRRINGTVATEMHVDAKEKMDGVSGV